MYKPYWLNKKFDFTASRKMKETLRHLGVHTVCEEACCPNLTDCFSTGSATFLILGNICTRSCTFCSVLKGVPKKPDPGEPRKILEAIRSLNLRYVVITSPTRDDLGDGGASIFCRTVKSIKRFDKTIKVEILIPDFLGKQNAIEKITLSAPDTLSHNLETIPRLYSGVRSGADYQRSLGVLRIIKEINPNMHTKSGLMLGLGEKKAEVLGTFKDLRKVGCDFLTLGQYLAPSRSHYPVKEFISPKKFLYFAKEAHKLGFKKVKSSPYTRSSYLAHELLI
jgi:lipoic acid synthetase